ncbi:hypothetical protein C477_15895 [Haloterrigena salina JCM 13891]|uniref:Uncharacterized protein n=1 Tax=Haloterrigena salina JCM 13891 TaxID=1227488 RepID=M0C3Q5_9EURY|nr:hypothetical protein [Haloterrigena salina]ELZ16529.1 hypothetical protein C477_15895 [Haloterrigena salina JCM 13891]
MTDRSRRAILCGAAGLIALSAGCLDEANVSDDADGTDDVDPDESEPEPAASDAPSEDDGLEASDAVSFDHNQPREADATLLTGADRARGWLADRGLDGERYSAFVDETTFDDSVLLGLEATGRSLDYELALETVTVENDGDPTLVVEAAVRGESDEESGRLSGQQLIGVGQLVRATFDGELATDASVTIVDGDGESIQKTLAVDSASESTEASGFASDADDA